MIKKLIQRTFESMGYTMQRLPSEVATQSASDVCASSRVPVLESLSLSDYKVCCPPLFPAMTEVDARAALKHHPDWRTTFDNKSMRNYFNIDVDANERATLSDDYPNSHYYSRQRMLQSVYTKLIGSSLEGMSVLDIGCSSGYYSFFAARAGASPVVGIDARPEHADQFRLLHGMLKMPETCQYRHVDMETELETLRETFDIVLAQGVFYHVYDQPRFIKNLYRLTNRVLILEGQCSGRADKLCFATIEDVNDMRSSIHGPVIYPALSWMIELSRWAGFREVYYVPLPPEVPDAWGFGTLHRAMLACVK